MTHLKETKNTDLMKKVLKEGHSFSFFQIVRILRRLIAKSTNELKSIPVSNSALQIKPELTLAFPASDVESVQNLGDIDDPRFLILVNFLGLYGTSSPLPIFYTEDLIDEKAEDESTVRDFTDIINQRIFALLFESWSKYRQYLKVAEEKDSNYINRLFCMIGLGEESSRREIPESYSLLRYMGLLTQHPRSGIGLETFLSDALGIPITVIPCIQRTVQIPEDQRCRLGGKDGSMLGVDVYLGDNMEDRMGKFRLQLGPLSANNFKRFSPGSEDFEKLTLLTGFYFVDPLEFDIELIMEEGTAPTMCLGDSNRSTLNSSARIKSVAPSVRRKEI